MLIKYGVIFSQSGERRLWKLFFEYTLAWIATIASIERSQVKQIIKKDSLICSIERSQVKQIINMDSCNCQYREKSGKAGY